MLQRELAKHEELSLEMHLNLPNSISRNLSTNNYDPLMNQHFIQEIFYVTNIERDEEIQAVTANNTRSFYSICSTGNFLIIEAREVSCCCKSCMENGEKNAQTKPMLHHGEQLI